MASEKADAMATFERDMQAPEGFVAASAGPEGGSRTGEMGSAPIRNPDALDVDLDDEELPLPTQHSSVSREEL